jgi:hypothetical protein
MTVPANPIRKSVPTAGMERFWDCGWAYVMPDFDHPDHSIIEWLSTKAPVEPSNRVPVAPTESANDRAANRA